MSLKAVDDDDSNTLSITALSKLEGMTTMKSCKIAIY